MDTVLIPYEGTMSKFKDPKLKTALKEARRQFKGKRKHKGDPVPHARFFKDLRAGKKVKFKGAFQENYYHVWKWKKRVPSLSFIKRIESLIKLTTIQIYGNTQSYSKRRKKKHSARGKTCEVCWVNKAICQHHMILLINGGYDNGINRICICRTCHTLMHPWMDKKWMK